MPQCIYSLKELDDSYFLSEEHIIPACIGGQRRLPKGYVSDEVNNKFSTIERDFAKNSIISIPRMWYDPGKRGSLSYHKASSSNIHVMVRN